MEKKNIIQLYEELEKKRIASRIEKRKRKERISLWLGKYIT
jgi:hypothetical protein